MDSILQKRTKIVATIGPASREAGDDAFPASSRGANVFRLNFSHGTPAEHGDVIAQARRISAELGTTLALLQDLPGPKVRTGPLAGDAAFVRLERGATFVLTTQAVPGTAARVSVSYPDLPADVAIGKRIYLQDGQITLRIVDKSATEIVTTVEFGGDLRSTQGINYPDGSLNLHSVTDRDFEYLAFGLEHDVDYVAISFVRSADDVRKVKSFIAERGKDTPVLAKIEKHEALEDIDAIIAQANGIMVARGDLGIEMPLEAVPMIQKDLIARCNRAGKPVVTATQMLESMISSLATDTRRGDRRRQRDSRRNRRRDALGRNRARRLSRPKRCGRWRRSRARSSELTRTIYCGSAASKASIHRSPVRLPKPPRAQATSCARRSSQPARRRVTPRITSPLSGRARGSSRSRRTNGSRAASRCSGAPNHC